MNGINRSKNQPQVQKADQKADQKAKTTKFSTSEKTHAPVIRTMHKK